jgi:hypothetical protein
VPVSTKTKLNASKWYYTDGKSQFEWNNWELRAIYLEKEDIVNDQKNIKFEY